MNPIDSRVLSITLLACGTWRSKWSSVICRIMRSKSLFLPLRLGALSETATLSKRNTRLPWSFSQELFNWTWTSRMLTLCVVMSMSQTRISTQLKSAIKELFLQMRDTTMHGGALETSVWSKRSLIKPPNSFNLQFRLISDRLSSILTWEWSGTTAARRVRPWVGSRKPRP